VKTPTAAIRRCRCFQAQPALNFSKVHLSAISSFGKVIAFSLPAKIFTGLAA
jgi:hypothetical protein